MTVSNLENAIQTRKQMKPFELFYFWLDKNKKQKKKQIANIHIKANVSLACDFNLFL